MRSVSNGAMYLALICAVATAAPAQTTPAQTTDATPIKPEDRGPLPAFAVVGPSRELKLGEFTWFRFGAQVQGWARIAQDRILQTNGSDGGFAVDYYCRRCRLFTTGSIVKNVFFNILFEASNLGKSDPTTGVKSFAAPNLLDAYAQVKFHDTFWLSGGNILLPLTRNGLQPTTTYLSIDTSNVAATPALQGNTAVLRDLGFQANGFFASDHVEYRAGVFQGTRQAAVTTGTGAAAVTTQTASHNAPRFVAMLAANLWDTETGYVNGGHYYGAKKVLGIMGNFDYQVLRTDSPPAVGTAKNAYKGVSGAVFINYPLSGTPNPRGGDELVGLLQVGYYDGGFTTSPAGAATNPGSYPNILKQINYLAEAAYYNRDAKLSFFGKFEKRAYSDDYPTALKAVFPIPAQTWIAFGLKYYVAPANLLNLGLQYEHITNDDAPGTQQSGTHNITFQMQAILY